MASVSSFPPSIEILNLSTCHRSPDTTSEPFPFYDGPVIIALPFGRPVQRVGLGVQTPSNTLLLFIMYGFPDIDDAPFPHSFMVSVARLNFCRFFPLFLPTLEAWLYAAFRVSSVRHRKVVQPPTPFTIALPPGHGSELLFAFPSSLLAYGPVLKSAARGYPTPKPLFMEAQISPEP